MKINTSIFKIKFIYFIYFFVIHKQLKNNEVNNQEKYS